MDTGALRNSGFTKTEQNGDTITTVIGFAKDGDPPYAVFIHERHDLNHAAPTCSGFLLEAAKRFENRIAAILADKIRRTHGGG